VAEDDEKLRKLFHVVLTQRGYKVIVVQNGEDAVDSFVKNKDCIQMVILDMVMPKKNGKEAANEIRGLRPDMKVLFLSGYTADRTDVQELRDKNMHFLFKPVSPRDLLTKVRAILDI
jgi:DNA-binding response OmpR family regulator